MARQKPTIFDVSFIRLNQRDQGIHMSQKGKSPSTQAGEFVRKVIEDIRDGKHGARSAKQAIAIGLSEARRAGVKLPPSPKGTRAAKHVTAPSSKKPSPRRSKAALMALKREPTNTVSKEELSKLRRKQKRIH